MIIKQLAVPKAENQSFQIRRDYVPKYQSIWHYHEEMELVHIHKGTGTLFLGDRIIPFKSGDTVLIGIQMPHYWLFDENLFDSENEEPIDCIVIHFKKDFGILHLLQLPELSRLKSLFDNSNRGLLFDFNEKKDISKQFYNLLSIKGLDKLTSFLHLLEKLIDLPAIPITSENYSILMQSEDEFRMSELMNYIRGNYKHKIKLEELSHIAKMTENSFCRYFKQKTGKTPIQFITEIRISHACTQLKNSQMQLKEICYDSGFNNFVSFHKCFKEITGFTPIQYRES